MSDGRGVIREIAWRELFPWLVLFRTFRLSIHPAILSLALLAAILTPIGWRIGQATFGVLSQVEVPPAVGDTLPGAPPARDPLPDELGRMPGMERHLGGNVHERILNPTRAFTSDSPIIFVFEQITRPVRRMYRYNTGLREFAFYLFGTLWTLAVWAFAGGMITRIAAVELGREEQATIRRSATLVSRRWLDYFTAPLYPILGTFLIAIVTVPVGWLLLANVGTVVAGLLWILALLGGAVSALLLLWLFIGWPLMWPAISSEETGDAFEAMSRSFAYAFQRPLNYLFYAAVATLFGYICWSVVDFLCLLTIEATRWAVSWGCGTIRLDTILQIVETGKSKHLPPNEAVPASLQIGAGMIWGVESILRAISESFAYAFFWVSATAIYLLLRQDVDRGEFDEVWADDETSRHPLPQLNPETVPTTGPATLPIVETPTAPAVSSPPLEDKNNQAE